MCSVCLSPPLGRKSSLYNIDMDWIREGKLSRLSSGHFDVENELKTLSDLMLDLVNLSNVLHSLQVGNQIRNKRKPIVTGGFIGEVICGEAEEQPQGIYVEQLVGGRCANQR